MASPVCEALQYILWAKIWSYPHSTGPRRSSWFGPLAPPARMQLSSPISVAIPPLSIKLLQTQLMMLSHVITIYTELYSTYTPYGRRLSLKRSLEKTTSGLILKFWMGLLGRLTVLQYRVLTWVALQFIVLKASNFHRRLLFLERCHGQATCIDKIICRSIGVEFIY